MIGIVRALTTTFQLFSLHLGNKTTFRFPKKKKKKNLTINSLILSYTIKLSFFTLYFFIKKLFHLFSLHSLHLHIMQIHRPSSSSLFSLNLSSFHLFFISVFCKLQVGDLQLILLGFFLQAGDWVRNQNQNLSFNWLSIPF